MQLSEIKKIINNGSEEEKVILRDYFKKYGNTLEKEEEVHNILVDTILNLSKEEVILLSGIIGYPVFLRICLIPKIRHKYPLLQDGASLIIFNRNGEFVTQQRMDNGKYGFSGGCQELGEELQEVANRECFEETGLLAKKDKIIEVAEVSGLSRKNSYPNGDIVVNNTALHMAYVEDTTGELREDFESKKVEFNTVEFLDSLPDELKHEKDLIEICRMILAGRNPIIEQPRIKEVDLPERGDLSFADYLYSLDEEQALWFAKTLGFKEFLMQAIDERIRDVFPHLIDKGVLIDIKDDEILVEQSEEGFILPKRIQTVGECFEETVCVPFGIDKHDLKLGLRLSGRTMYNEEDNSFANVMVYEPVKELTYSLENLSYQKINLVMSQLGKEDETILQAYIDKKNKDESLILIK